LLEQFSSHSFASTRYENAIPLKSLAAYANAGSGGYTQDLTKTGGMYDQTGVSEEGLVMVTEDRSRTKEDLKEFKVGALSLSDC